MAKDLIEKKEKTWTALTVMNDVKARLDRVKRGKEREHGMTLSWSKFFSLILPGLEKALPIEKPR